MVNISTALVAATLCIFGCGGRRDTQTLSPLNVSLAPDSLFDISPALWSEASWSDSLYLFRVHGWLFDGDSSDVVYRVRADFDGDGTEDVALALGAGRRLVFDVFRLGDGPPRYVGAVVAALGGLGVCPRQNGRPRITADYHASSNEYERFVSEVYPDSVSLVRESLDNLTRTNEGPPEGWGQAHCECPVIFEEAPGREWLERGDDMWRPAVLPDDYPSWLAPATYS